MNDRMKKLGTCLLLVLCAAAAPAFAQLRLTITSGVTDPIAIAIVPFARAVPADGGLDVAQIIQRDLESTGRFKGMARTDMVFTPTTAAEVDSAGWKQQRVDYVVVGRVTSQANGQVRIDAELVNVLTGQRVAGPNVTTAASNLRNAAHRIADAVFEKIIGVRGAFATRIAYVSVDGKPPSQRYELYVADADGANRVRILASPLPIMSPAWSSDGEWLAYVSFERRVSAVYVQHRRSGKKSMVSARAGINGAPTFSPDDKKLALTLSGSNGNLDVYLLELANGKLTRLTDDPGIDTEAVFTPDGTGIYFTSDRSGSPQIYRMTLGSSERPKRITFTGSYNARPRISPDGKQLALLTLDDGAYRIGVQDLANGTVTMLSKGRQEESPSFAPNGAMLIFAGRERGQGVLQTVSVDGQTSARLDADAGEVREPVWGPFLP
ncbi:MAG TPA: Tol-Pal system beta propeller repeat protein TolB [Steroidobacteraceae bacterium]|nr:Tol-Pal system beta propeller repeat protein TolB [Steroidobacteraceae bacterium]